MTTSFARLRALPPYRASDAQEVLPKDLAHVCDRLAALKQQGCKLREHSRRRVLHGPRRCVFGWRPEVRMRGENRILRTRRIWRCVVEAEAHVIDADEIAHIGDTVSQCHRGRRTIR